MVANNSRIHLSNVDIKLYSMETGLVHASQDDILGQSQVPAFGQYFSEPFLSTYSVCLNVLF